MSIFGKIYKRNIYGIIGTLVFHILLVSTFLLAEIDMKGNVKADELIIEFPDILPELEELEEQIKEQEIESEIPDNASGNNNSNAASNRLAKENTTQSAEEFLDDEFAKEIEEARQLLNTANKQIAKEIVDIKDIKMPVETTEGMNPDSIKNVIYSGESNIVYYLENRYHISLPIPVYLAQGGGKVIVDIVVNQSGEVIKAISRNNPAIRDKQIIEYAQIAASKTIFNSDPKAPAQQTGTIHYTFISQ